MHKIVRVVSIVLVSVLGACSDPSAPISLSVNRARWESQNLHDYSYIGRQFCICPPGSKPEVMVVVLSDTVFSARAVGTTVEQPKGAWLTVPQLFDFAESSYRNGDYENVRVEYHPELRYPTLISLYPPAYVADGGYTLVIRDLGGLMHID